MIAWKLRAQIYFFFWFSLNTMIEWENDWIFECLFQLSAAPEAPFKSRGRPRLNSPPHRQPTLNSTLYTLNFQGFLQNV